MLGKWRKGADTVTRDDTVCCDKDACAQSVGVALFQKFKTCVTTTSANCMYDWRRNASFNAYRMYGLKDTQVLDLNCSLVESRDPFYKL